MHREGDVALKTIKNLKTVIAYAKRRRNWKAIEVIAILDRADAETYAVAAENEEFFSHIETVNFGDPALSRNRGVEIAKNNFISFADGDDYVSHNAAVELYKAFYRHYSKLNKPLDSVENDEHIAIFPKLIISYPKLHFKNFVDSNDFAIKNLLFTLSYNTRISCARILLVSNKLGNTASPYGFEDWDLNNRLLSSGVKFIGIKRYWLFYRKEHSIHSVNKKDIQNSCIPRNSFSYSYHLLNENLNSSTSIAAENKFPEKILEATKKFLSQYGENNLTVPSELKLHQTTIAEKILAPYKIYAALCRFLETRQIVFMIPRLESDGADLLLPQYIKSLRSEQINIAVIVTEMEFKQKLTRNEVDYLFIKSLPEWNSIDEYTQNHIVLKALINAPLLMAIHFIHSVLGYKLIMNYFSVLKENGKKIIYSLFWLENSITEIYKYSDLVLGNINYWQTHYTATNYYKLISPVESVKFHQKEKHKPTRKIFSIIKTFNLNSLGVLSKIINYMPLYTFVLYGSQLEEMINQDLVKHLLKLPNIKYRGKYQKIDSIDFSEFDLFLYVSSYEGLPNTVIEIAKISVPMVVANTGGMAEFLGDNYPLLVNAVEDPLAYVEKINEYYADSTQEQAYNHLASTEFNNFEQFSKEYLQLISKERSVA